MNRIVFSAVLFTILVGGCAKTSGPRPTAATKSATTAPTVDRWQKEIGAFLNADEKNAPAQGGIVFVGSSSIRGWRTLKTDFPGLNVIGRGFGGSEAIDVIRFTDVLVLKHRPRAVVFYAGENDIASHHATPADVLRHFQTFVDLTHRELPKAKIIFIGLKPSPSRLGMIEQFREANSLVRAFVQTDDRLRYIDVMSQMLDAQDQPRPELFLKDRLHMTPEGYALWTKLVRPELE